MSPENFSTLSLSMKIEYLRYEGTVICERDYQGNYLSLFILNGLFVEALLNTQDEIQSINLINAPEALYAYVEHLNIHTLFTFTPIIKSKTDHGKKNKQSF